MQGLLERSLLPVKPKALSFTCELLAVVGRDRLASGSSGLQGDVCSIVMEALHLLVSRTVIPYAADAMELLLTHCPLMM
jgi:hypothetical protein